MALREMVAVLEQARVKYVVVGSVAASAWGVVRMTRDVDVFVMPASDKFTTQRLNDRVSAVVFDVSTWIDRAENVVLAKLRWRLETRSETQWRDCVEIAAINNLDARYLKGWAVELGVEEDLLELLALD